MKKWFQKKDKKSRGSTPVMSQVDPSSFIDGLVYGQLIQHDEYHARDYGSHDSSPSSSHDGGSHDSSSGGYDSGGSDGGGCGCD